MQTIRTIVIDDEILGRSRVKKLLESHGKVLIVGEGKNGREAVDLIKNYKPDLAFMDIEMPELNGMEAVRSIPANERPFIVFVTAHDQFALKAFDVQATDFVLKPYDEKRFNQSIERAIEQIELKAQSSLGNKMMGLLDSYRSKTQSNPYMITVKNRGVEKNVNLYDVISIEAEGNYLQLNLDKERILIRQTMQEFIETLDQSCFLRIHRSIIINCNYLKTRSYQGNNEYSFKMRIGKSFLSGRSYKQNIDEFFTN